MRKVSGAIRHSRLFHLAADIARNPKDRAFARLAAVQGRLAATSWQRVLKRP